MNSTKAATEKIGDMETPALTLAEAARLFYSQVLHAGTPRRDNRTIKRQAAAAKFLRSRDAARYLGISEWTLRELAHEGEIRYIQRTPRSPMLFDVADLDKWVERNKR